MKDKLTKSQASEAEQALNLLTRYGLIEWNGIDTGHTATVHLSVRHIENEGVMLFVNSTPLKKATEKFRTTVANAYKKAFAAVAGN